MSTAGAGQARMTAAPERHAEALRDARRRNVRRSALILAAVALLFYFGFIVLSVVRAG